MIKVFISHSSRDVALAKLIIDLLRSALNLSSSEIRCTSVPGYGLPGGVETDKEIRSELLTALVFVGLITGAGLASAYVLFELGARWGAEKQLIPLMAPGISPEILEGPISNIDALSCSSEADLDRLMSQVADELKIKIEQHSVYKDQLEIVTISPPVISITEPQTSASPAPQVAIDRLAELRSEGIANILNFRVSNDDELQTLSYYNQRWGQEVVDVLEKNFSKAEQLNFNRLGTIPLITLPHSFNEKHAKILREFAMRERRLLDIIAVILVRAYLRQCAKGFRLFAKPSQTSASALGQERPFEAALPKVTRLEVAV